MKLLNDEDFQKYLQRSLATAESQAANSFHCQTPNCHGWCIYDDEVNDFDCPVCQKRNCLTCKAIHFPTNCKEYQDDLKRNSANDEAARKTQEYLEVSGGWVWWRGNLHNDLKRNITRLGGVRRGIHSY